MNIESPVTFEYARECEGERKGYFLTRLTDQRKSEKGREIWREISNTKREREGHTHAAREREGLSEKERERQMDADQK